MQLEGNTILITGGGSGIGRALAEAFHARANTVVIAGRRRELLANTVVIAGRRRELLDEVTTANPGMRSAVLDIADGDSIPAFAAKLLADFPALDAVIHNAGVMKTETLAGGKPGDAEPTVATNLLGPIRLNAALLPALLKRPRATVMTVSSGLAFVPMALTPTYCATKAAIHSYTQSLRYQLRGTPVEVVELVPPKVQTDLTPGQSTAADAMPLADFVAEVMQILESAPATPEVCVARVMPLRTAESSGNYDGFYAKFNDAVSAARAGH